MSQPWFATWSRGLAARRHLPAALGGPVRVGPPAGAPPTAVIGWGAKDNTRAARAWAVSHNIPFWTIEDGPVRSVGLGVCGSEPFGFSIDRQGVPYDASRASELESVLQAGLAVDRPLAQDLMRRIAAAGICKYNHDWSAPAVGPRRAERILLVDQTVGDLGVQLAGGGPEAFAAMAATARAEHPEAELLILVHPDVRAGKRSGYLDSVQLHGARILDHPGNPQQLMKEVDRVFTVSSQLGIEALIADVPVTCFAAPWYAGWGATDDRGPVPERRTARRDAVELFWAYYHHCARYVDPVTGAPCDLAHIVGRLESHAAQMARGRSACAEAQSLQLQGVAWWKRGAIRSFLEPLGIDCGPRRKPWWPWAGRQQGLVQQHDTLPGGSPAPDAGPEQGEGLASDAPEVRIPGRPADSSEVGESGLPVQQHGSAPAPWASGSGEGLDSDPPEGSPDQSTNWHGVQLHGRSHRTLFWGSHPEAAAAQAADMGTICEDGFLRSVGLGSDAVRPASLVLDRRGIYYDATRPSDLEVFLAEHCFDDQELAVGSDLIDRLRAAGITKYNAGAQVDVASLLPTSGAQRILVPGQVAGDQSIRLGGVDIRDDEALVRAVRADFPDDCLVYKPHPDVLAGNRAGGIRDPSVRRLIDVELHDVAIDTCLRAVDRVATITSLCGFEALILGKQVSTYGLPFYAGWGLTSDRHQCPRRGRQLSLPALVHATLSWYPIYRDWNSGLSVDAATVIDQLARQRAQGTHAIGRPDWRTRLWRWGMALAHAGGFGRR